MPIEPDEAAVRRLGWRVSGTYQPQEELSLEWSVELRVLTLLEFVVCGWLRRVTG